MRPSRTGGSVSAGNNSLPAPHLEAGEEEDVAWFYQGPLPDQWALYSSPMPDDITAFYVTVDNTDTNAGGFASAGQDVVLIGLSFDQTRFQTSPSNPVTLQTP